MTHVVNRDYPPRPRQDLRRIVWTSVFWPDDITLTLRMDKRETEHQAQMATEPPGKYETQEAPMICEMCRTQRTMRQIMAMIEDLTCIGESLFDDTVTDVFTAAEAALSMFEHNQPCGGDNQLSLLEARS